MENPYTHIVEEIMLDKASLGQYDYYKEDKSSYDPIIGKLQRDIVYYTDMCSANRKTMDTIINNITSAKKQVTGKKVKESDIDRWEQECSRLQLEFVTYKDILETLQPRLEDCMFNRYIEEFQRKSLKYLRDTFFENGDKAALEEGIVAAMAYAKKHRIKMEFRLMGI